MDKEPRPDNKIDIGIARQHIESVRAEVAQMGANDSEFSSLNQIISDLEDRIITPEEAISRANKVRDSKQSYH